MKAESTEKAKTKRKNRWKGVVTMNGIPTATHERIQAYQEKISFDRRKFYTIKEAYKEFVIEKAAEPFAS